jgi:hypothetical protein
MKKFSILLGNGMNNLDADNSWDNLLQRLAADIGFTIDEEKKKQFPLLYEEIFLTGANLKKKGVSETQLKKSICDNVSQIKKHPLYDVLRALPTDDIITTNYDFSVEGFEPKKNEGIVKEMLYSVFRHYRAGNKRVWHVHGDRLHPNSVNLGFEHYSGQLQNIRNYVATGTKYASKKYQLPLIKRLETGFLDGSSWLDLFFTTDIHIIGLTLGFVETDLWWLLTYRARIKIKKPKLVPNTITYYTPQKFVASSKHKLDLLEATGVNVEKINKDGEAYYQDILSRLGSAPKKSS